MIYLYTDEIVDGCESTDDISIIEGIGEGRSKITGCYISKEGNDFTADRIKYICLSDNSNSVIISLSKLDKRIIDIILGKRLCIYNAKHYLPFLFKEGIIQTKVYCPIVVDSVLLMGKEESSSMSLQSISERYKVEYFQRTKDNNPYNGLNAQSVSYMCGHSTSLIKIRERQLLEAKEALQVNACVLETKTIPVMAYIKYCGVSIDKDILRKAIEEDVFQHEELSKELDEFVFKNFRGNTKLCKIDDSYDLFEGQRNSKECLVKWNNEKSIEKLMGFITEESMKKELEDKISKYRSLGGVISSYRGMYNKDWSYIHPDYTQISGYGRISPIYKTTNKYGREEDLPVIINMPKKYRNSIKPKEGNVFITSDWKSQEMRIIANVSGDGKMKKIISENDDVHSFIAKSFLKNELRNKSEEEIKNIGKIINFSFIYGGKAYSIAQKLGIPDVKAVDICLRYANAFKGIVKYQNQMSSMVLVRGYISMNAKYGYRYYIKNLERLRAGSAMTKTKGFWKSYKDTKDANPDSFMVKEAMWFMSERKKLDNMSYNAPIQNYGSIMLKSCLVSLFDKIISYGMFGKVMIVLPQHDSITIECSEETSEIWKEELKNIMIRPECDEYDGVYPVDIKIKDSL